MMEPPQFTLEQLCEEDGMDIRCGLPEGLRIQLDAAHKREVQAAELSKQTERILASIAEHESQIAQILASIAEGRIQLRRVIREYTQTATAPAPVETADECV